ncbi:hypothetical protein FQA47_014611 [Oryzias melastigma]|uniref:Uncharacterized protein n=1 Tax=Oryzias melastigma TaxID=30732 RepID=A0A834FLS1_ORYME|nr:hypothetical protein FQA47_014611 [Oryzias melastigma]
MLDFFQQVSSCSPAAGVKEARKPAGTQVLDSFPSRSAKYTKNLSATSSTAAWDFDDDLFAAELLSCNPELNSWSVIFAEGQCCCSPDSQRMSLMLDSRPAHSGDSLYIQGTQEVTGAYLISPYTHKTETLAASGVSGAEHHSSIVSSAFCCIYAALPPILR